MHEIRVNKEAEKTIVSAKFKIPSLLIVLFVFLFLSPLLTILVSIFSGDGDYLIFGITMLIVFVSLLIVLIVGIKKNSCIVTNKRIYGVTSFLIARKKYSYRLDEIDNIETVSTMGVHGLSLNFSQGHGPQGKVRYNRGVATVSGAGTFRITNIANIDEVYEKLSELLVSVKNDKDLMVDIEMSKVEAENRKAAAFENMANHVGGATLAQAPNSNYIQELKELKGLLDAGIINEEEFEEKKKTLLKQQN